MSIMVARKKSGSTQAMGKRLVESANGEAGERRQERAKTRAVVGRDDWS
jgi:hypothetical protein